MFVIEEKQLNEKPLNDEKVEQATQKTDEQIQAENNLDAAIPELPNETQSAAAQPAANAVDSLYGLLSLLPIGLMFAGMKNTAAVWTETTCHGLAAACVPVFRKYAWGQKIIVFLETGGGVEELALIAVAMPIGLATYKAIEADTKKPVTVTDTEQPKYSKNGIEMANADDVKYESTN